MRFAEEIKKRREQLGLTQRDLAEKLFVSRQTVCRWENGSRCPDLIMAKKLAVVLGISLDELIPSEAVANYTPEKEHVVDLSCIKVMLTGMMILLIGIFFCVVDGTGIYMDISSICFLVSIIIFVVGVFIPMNAKEPVIDDELPQKICPSCGKKHDFDYPQCPYCNYDYR